MPDPREQQLFDAVTQAQQRYPWIRSLGVPIKLRIGQGPYMSESFMPTAEDNPARGNFTVELRNSRLVNDPSQWPAALGREGMDYMARADPVFQAYASAFQKLLTQPQLDRAKARYQRDMPNGYHGQGPSEQDFQDFLKGAEVQEYLGGYVFNMKGWEEAGWTPEQKKLLDNLKQYMWQGQTPSPVNIP